MPLKKDTIWLECTNQRVPFGYLGTFTSDREVLIIEDQNSKLVRTPSYPLELNAQKRTAKVKIDKEGNGTVESETKYEGLQYENDNYPWILYESPEDQKKKLYNNISLPSFEIANFTLKEEKTEKPFIKENLTLKLNKYASVSGKRIFVIPNLLNRQGASLSDKPRKFDIVLKTAFVDFDTIDFELPTGMQPEYLPPVTELITSFGKYRTEYKFESGHFIYLREFRMNKNTFPAKDYPAFKEFMQAIKKNDNSKIVFVAKD